MILKRGALGCVGVLCLAACSGNTSRSQGSGGSGSDQVAAAGAGAAPLNGGGSAGNPPAGTGGSPPSAAGSGGTPAAGSGGTPAAGSGGTPAAGTGGRLPNSPEDATKAEECVYNGGGGANGWSCDYVSIEFSEPLPKADLEIAVTTSDGDVLVPEIGSASSAFGRPPKLFVKASADGAQALGLAISGSGHLDQDYAPEWVDVVVRSGAVTAADSRVPLTYSCVALTTDDWCWMAKTELLEVTR